MDVMSGKILHPMHVFEEWDASQIGSSGDVAAIENPIMAMIFALEFIASAKGASERAGCKPRFIEGGYQK